MYDPAPDYRHQRTRFGLAEALLLVAILLVGGYAVLSDSRPTIAGPPPAHGEAIDR